MIFVITGTEAYPFNRLIEKIDRLKENKKIQDDVFIQLGSCTFVPEHCSWKQWLSFSEMKEHINNSNIVITHAGAGTTLLCLELGKKPLLVTRKKKYGEHLDDHQVPFARMMEKLQYAFVAYDVESIENYLGEMVNGVGDMKKMVKNNSALISFLESYL